MPIIQYFNYNNQLSNCHNYILELLNEISELNKTIQKLNKSLKTANKVKKKLRTEISKLNGTYVEPDKETSKSPSYEHFILDIEPIKVPSIVQPTLDYKDLLSKGKYKPSKAHLKANFANHNQLCPQCSSTKEWHYMNGPNQKRCKLCLKTFNVFKEIREKSILKCPYCLKSLEFRVHRSNFDVYACKNKECSYRKQRKEQLIKEKGELHPRDKISYIYRDIKISISNVFSFIEDSKLDEHKRPFSFRTFNSHIFSLVISYKVNLKLSSRDTAIALRDIHGINICKSTVNNYCDMAARIISPFNYTHKPEKISNRIVGDETYIKIKGKRYYVWILYDLEYKNVVTYHISEKRDMSACATVFLKLIQCYKEAPEELFVMSDMYTAYPMALQFIQKELDIKITHTSVKGLEEVEGEDSETRRAKQIIERLNRVFKESYRITTGYGSLKGVRYSFELWMFYYNFMRRNTAVRNNPFRNSLNFISSKTNVDELLIQDRWLYVFDYARTNLIS